MALSCDLYPIASMLCALLVRLQCFKNRRLTLKCYEVNTSISEAFEFYPASGSCSIAAKNSSDVSQDKLFLGSIFFFLLRRIYSLCNPICVPFFGLCQQTCWWIPAVVYLLDLQGLKLALLAAYFAFNVHIILKITWKRRNASNLQSHVASCSQQQGNWNERIWWLTTFKVSLFSYSI